MVNVELRHRRKKKMLYCTALRETGKPHYSTPGAAQVCAASRAPAQRAWGPACMAINPKQPALLRGDQSSVLILGACLEYT